MGINNTFNPDDYGGTTTAAMAACVAAARAAGGAIILSPGKKYLSAAPIRLDWMGAGIASAVPGVKAKIVATVPNINVIELQGGTGVLEQLCVSDLIISRGNASGVEPAPLPNGWPNLPAISAVAGTGCGIRQIVGAPRGTTNLGRSHIQNCEIKNHFNGLHLGGTDFSTIDTVDIHHNVGHGVHMYAEFYLPLQWYWSGQNLSQFNGGDGFCMSLNPSIVQPGGISIATITNFAAFANAGYSMSFLGTANCPIISVRLSDIFIGGAGADELYMDTYGWDHRITGLYAELGPTRGVMLTANNKRSSFNDCHVTGMGSMGFAILGTDITLNNCQTSANGRNNLGPALQAGVYVEGARNSIVGGHHGGIPGATQSYGVFFGAGTNHAMIGVNVSGNTTGPINVTPTTYVGNFS